MGTKDEQENTGIETAVGVKGALSMDSTSEEVISDAGQQGSIDTMDLEDDVKDQPEADKVDQEEEPAKEDKPEEEEAPTEELGEFKPEDAAKWEAAYTKDGTVDQAKLSAEFWKNADTEKGVAGGLNEGTYSWLASKGFAKADVKAIEEALVIKATETEKQLYTKAGGKDAVMEAFEWATKGKGYTQAQKNAFNKAVKSNDAAAIADAYELVVNRYKAANPPPKQRKETKGTTMGTEAASNSNVAYASEAEMAQAQSDIKTIKDSGKRNAAWQKHLQRSAAMKKK